MWSNNLHLHTLIFSLFPSMFFSISPRFHFPSDGSHKFSKFLFLLPHPNSRTLWIGNMFPHLSEKFWINKLRGPFLDDFDRNLWSNNPTNFETPPSAHVIHNTHCIPTTVGSLGKRTYHVHSDWFSNVTGLILCNKVLLIPGQLTTLANITTLDKNLPITSTCSPTQLFTLP